MLWFLKLNIRKRHRGSIQQQQVCRGSGIFVDDKGVADIPGCGNAVITISRNLHLAAADINYGEVIDAGGIRNMPQIWVHSDTRSNYRGPGATVDDLNHVVMPLDWGCELWVGGNTAVDGLP